MLNSMEISYSLQINSPSLCAFLTQSKMLPYYPLSKAHSFFLCICRPQRSSSSSHNTQITSKAAIHTTFVKMYIFILLLYYFTSCCTRSICTIKVETPTLL
mmetsp:Transcript_48510/g.96115  ORF Transcript_48510/g.96115 Transcript_48510/m.96115 type:complete len:101 (-) Transcript_48510:184-486(-)